MACLEHECRDCGRVVFSNYPRPGACVCGSTDLRTTWDEELDRDDDDEGEES